MKEFQGAGHGTELISRLFDEFIKRSYRLAMVWVLSENPYRGFYEKLGGIPFQVRTIEIAGQAFSETAYKFSLTD